MERATRKENSEVTVEDIANVVSTWTRIPVSKLAPTVETDKIIKLRIDSSRSCYWSR